MKAGGKEYKMSTIGIIQIRFNFEEDICIWGLDIPNILGYTNVQDLVIYLGQNLRTVRGDY